TPGTPGSEGDIWYNPIPEDEDGEVGSSWCPGAKLAAPGGRGGEEAAAGRSQACGKVPIPCVTSGLPSASSSPPGSPRRGRAPQQRQQHRAKSPGTVARLSFKMKKLPELRRKLSLRSPRAPRGAQEVGTEAGEAGKESNNVISRYHLDSSVGTAPGPPKGKAVVGRGGGYLSDGDAPEVPAGGAAQEEGEEDDDDDEEDDDEEEEDGGGEKGLQLALYQPYSGEEAVPAAEGTGQRLSGMVSVHLRGLKEMKAAKGEVKEVFCVLQVDSVARARTALLSSARASLSLNHTFNLELEGAERLKVVVFSWDSSAGRSRVLCQGSLLLPQLFRGCRAQQLAVQLQPRGVLYSKVTLVELWDNPQEKEPRVFGVDLCQLVEREKTTPKVPLIIQKCVAEIEKRGLKV
ncbi:SYDE2 protein, partial [Tricholaema leucomelas]|nr:SYDE2 protein [Tricholaema leucomelas]